MANPYEVERLAQQFRAYIRSKAGLQGPDWFYISEGMKNWYRMLACRALEAQGA